MATIRDGGAGGAANVVRDVLFRLAEASHTFTLMKEGIAMATATKNGKSKTLPVHKIRCGSTVATIWENDGENGAWHNTTVVRTYREKDSDEYLETSSYLESQLLELAKAADLAHSWIVARQAELRAERRRDQASEDRF